MKRMPGTGATRVAIAAVVVLATTAMASGPTSAAPTNPQWLAECGSCHVPYPPRMLPANSWRAIMDRLDSHFGTDASIDAATRASIGTFLAAHAASDGGASPSSPVLRITETARFIRKHHRISATTWRSDKVGNPANCDACHGGADRGSFSDHDVRIPR
jgi:cytochrome c553